MTTKLKGDIAEQAAILLALQQGWEVLRPVGDRLPYDLVFSVSGIFVRIQVKSAWKQNDSGNYVVDNRRTKTNRRIMKRDRYKVGDFDFALVYLEDINAFYIFPFETFVAYGSEIHMVESIKRQRKPRSSDYRNKWELIAQWATQKVISA